MWGDIGMINEQLRTMFPRASKSFLSVNAACTGPKPQPSVRNEPLATVQVKKANPRCRVLRVISYRTRICDTDNLCPKWIIDALRYAQIIEDDSPEHIELQVLQRKVEHRNEEKTLIELQL
jgi:Holliday junction resolvase RusA-like endonuclease